MKKHIWLAFALLFQLNLDAQTGIEPFDPATPGTYLGDFESFTLSQIIPDVSLYDEEGNLGDNLFADDGSGSGTTLTPGMGMFCAMLQSADSTITLVSPEMDFGIYTGSPTLTFRYFVDNGISFGAPGWFESSQIEVVYKESAGGVWNTIATFNTDDNIWHDEVIDLSGAGSYATYYLGFRVSTPLTGAAIAVGIMGFDEIVVTGESCSASTSSFPAGDCFSYTVPSGDETYAVSGTYMDTIPNTSGCDSIMTIDVTVITPDISVVAGSTLHANATGSAFQWVTCPSMTPVPGAVSADFVPAVDGNYAVVVTELGCIDTSACYAYVGASVDEEGTIGLLIYPNPADDLIILSSPSFLEIISLSIVGLDGKIWKTVPWNAAESTTLHIADLPAGEWFICATGDTFVYRSSFIKM